MHYQSDGTQVATRPIPAAVTGTPGYVSAGNPVTGAAPTDDDPDVMNAILDELCGLVTGLGGTLDKTNSNQIIQLLLAAFPGLVAAGRSIGTGAAGSTGYIKLPGGLILQWIRNSTGTADGTGAVLNTWTFPVPFQSTVVAYSYVATNENPNNADAGTIQAGAPTLTGQPIAHLRCNPGASVAFSGFVLGV